MALLQTPKKDDTFRIYGFSLENVDGRMMFLSDIQGEKGTVVAFICNHCPYVLAVVERMAADFKALQEEGIGCVAIMSNDTDSYPEDSFENMKLFAQKHGFTFPYLIDETQQIARAYGAICTPDIFGFNAEGVLQYRGRLDSAGPHEADAQTVRELFEVMRQIAETGTGPAEQFPSMGCSIKWR